MRLIHQTSKFKRAAISFYEKNKTKTQTDINLPVSLLNIITYQVCQFSNEQKNLSLEIFVGKHLTHLRLAQMRLSSKFLKKNCNYNLKSK
jgi:hypothetical protein